MEIHLWTKIICVKITHFYNDISAAKRLQVKEWNWWWRSAHGKCAKHSAKFHTQNTSITAKANETRCTWIGSIGHIQIRFYHSADTLSHVALPESICVVRYCCLYTFALIWLHCFNFDVHERAHALPRPKLKSFRSFTCP